MKTISTKECAAMIRECLKQGFPKTKFSVRMTRSTYSHNIDAYWTDGPTEKQVKPILDDLNPGALTHEPTVATPAENAPWQELR
jgi:hypothetical protein